MEILRKLFLSVYAHVRVGTHVCGHVEPKHWHCFFFSQLLSTKVFSMSQDSAVWLDYLASESMASTCLCCSPRAVCGYPCKPPTASFWYRCWASKLRSSSPWPTESPSLPTSKWWHFRDIFQCSMWLLYFFTYVFSSSTTWFCQRLTTNE